MPWKKFNAKTSIPALPDDTLVLDIRASGATFTIENWQAVASATHILYLIDQEERRIALMPINEFEVDDDDLALAYKISRNGYHRFTVTCTKLVKSLPFDLVDGQHKPGKWTLTFKWDGQRMVVDSEVKIARA